MTFENLLHSYAKNIYSLQISSRTWALLSMMRVRAVFLMEICFLSELFALSKLYKKCSLLRRQSAIKKHRNGVFEALQGQKMPLKFYKVQFGHGILFLWHISTERRTHSSQCICTELNSRSESFSLHFRMVSFMRDAMSTQSAYCANMHSHLNERVNGSNEKR